MAIRDLDKTESFVPALDTAALDASVADLRAGLPSWLTLPLRERIGLLRTARRRVGEEAPGMVSAACAAQGVRLDGPWVGEQWWGLVPFINLVRAFEEVLGRVAAGREPLAAEAVHTRPDGQVVVDVFPATGMDKMLFMDYRARVWMQPGVTPAEVRADAARAYRGHGFDDPGVALVLAAGNVASLPAMDVVHTLIGQGCVVALKMNPVNGYLRPFFERIFADFVDRGWLRFVDGGAAVGKYLAHHPGIDRLHMTGSAATHDALVWGTAEQAADNRAAGTPLLDKPFTAELGGVSPVIVVPGTWRHADVRRQADRIVSTKLVNCGHICCAAQILVLPDGWEHSEALLDQIRVGMRSLPPRQPYYPGTEAKVARAVARQPRVDVLVDPDHRVLVTDLDPTSDASLFTDEVFADVLGVVQLPAATVDEYLVAATQFANQRLAGTLAATILVDPATSKAHAAALDRAIADLRYGAIGVNEWAVMAAGFGYTTWGGFPGHTRQDIGSGTGVVNNAFLLNNPQKTTFTAGFRPLVKPVTAASHRTLATMMRRMVDFATTDELRALPGVFAAALRG